MKYQIKRVEKEDRKPADITCIAWDCLGEYWNDIHNGPYKIRLPGGRTLYSDAFMSGESNVRLAYLEPVENDFPKIKQVNRWVRGDQSVELVKDDMQ